MSDSQQCLLSPLPFPSHPPCCCCVQLVRNVPTVDYHMSRYKTVVEELQREIAELKTRLAQQGPLKSQFDKTEAARWVVGGACCHANTSDPPYPTSCTFDS